MALALKAGQMGVWEWNLLTGQSVWNAEMFGLLGLSPQTTAPAAEAFMALVLPEDRPALNDKLDEALRRDIPFSHDVRICRADTGEQRWIAARGRPRYNSAGERVAMVGVNFDVTEEINNQEKLKAAARRRADFLAVLGHELRNPLAPLAYLAHKMAATPEDSHACAEAAQLIQRQVAQLTRLVDDLLEVSRIELGKIELQKTQVLLERVIHNAIEAVRPGVRARQQALNLHVPPGVALQADAARLTQVLTNLLGNASKFTQPGGTIELRVSGTAQALQISVSDNGPGIPQDMMPLLFEPFTQGLATIDRAADGLGVGLSIVKRLVELHEGQVTVTSSEQGTTFTVMLPRPTAEQAPGASQETVPPTDSGAPPASALRFLVVEDNRDTAALLADLLKEEGHEIVGLAHDGVEAVTLARHHQPQVMLVDIGLPKLDGWGVAKTLRSEPLGRDILMVAISGYGQASDRERSRQAGFDLHLTKPADVGGLLGHLASMPTPRPRPV